MVISNKGFSLPELLVIITILAILSVVGAVVYSEVGKQLRDTKRKSDVNSLAKAYEISFDKSSGGYRLIDDTNADMFFADGVPKDPRGNDYFVEINPDGSGFRVCAAVESNSSNTCSEPNPTDCFCKDSQQGQYVAQLVQPPPTVLNGAFGVNTGSGNGSAILVEAMNNHLSETGSGWIRLACDWWDIEPEDNNQWNFTKCDQGVNKAQSLGLRVVVQLISNRSRFCDLSSLRGQSNSKPVCNDSQFQEFIQAVVSRYGTEAYEFDNEPDTKSYWTTDPGPDEYTRAMYLFKQAVDSVSTQAIVLPGGFAMNLPERRLFVQRLVDDADYPLLDNIDVFNYHTYSPRNALSGEYNVIRQAMDAKGKTNMDIWITEVGYPSRIIDQQNYKDDAYFSYPDNGEPSQASYMYDVMNYVLSLGVKKVFWYTFVDLPPDTSQFCSYGLVYLPGKQCDASAGDITGTLTRKQAYNQFRQITQQGVQGVSAFRKQSLWERFLSILDPVFNKD